MVNLRFRYVVEDVDRHGNVRLYFRRKGQAKIRLPGRPGSEEFTQVYRAALEGLLPPCKPNPKKTTSAGTLKWQCEAYYGSAEFQQLDVSTRRVRRNLLDELCRSHGDKPSKLMEARHVRTIRDGRADRPEAANALLKALRQVFSYAVDAELVDRNPTKDVPYLKSGSQGFHSWSPEELRQFEDEHLVGTKARLAFALLFETGQRRSDVIKFGRQHIRDGRISFTQHKNRNWKPVSLSIPLTSKLQEIIA